MTRLCKHLERCSRPEKAHSKWICDESATKSGRKTTAAPAGCAEFGLWLRCSSVIDPLSIELEWILAQNGNNDLMHFVAAFLDQLMPVRGGKSKSRRRVTRKVLSTREAPASLTILYREIPPPIELSIRRLSSDSAALQLSWPSAARTMRFSQSSAPSAAAYFAV